MLGIVKPQVISRLSNSHSVRQFVLRTLDNKLTDIVAGSVASHPLYNVTEIIRRQAQFVRTILHRGQPRFHLQIVVVIVAQQSIEIHQNIRIRQFPGQKLPIIEPLAKVQNKFYISYDNGILKFVVLF